MDHLAPCPGDSKDSYIDINELKLKTIKMSTIFSVCIVR